MLNTPTLPTLMPISITDNTIWAAASGPERKTPLRVRPYRMARPRGAFLAAELALLVSATLVTQPGVSYQVPVVIACCALFFHLRSLDRFIVSSNGTRFWSELLAGV